MSKVLTYSNSCGLVLDDALAVKTLRSVSRKFLTLRGKAASTSIAHTIWSDPVAMRLELLKAGLRPIQRLHYSSTRYHVFHSITRISQLLTGRYTVIGPSTEQSDYPRYMIPDLRTYSASLKWLLNGERSTGRSYLLAICLLEKGLHFQGKRVSYFDHYQGCSNNVMYDTLQNIIWDIELLRVRYTLSADGTGPWLGLNAAGATEVVLYR